jgi:ATP/ADP translocase
MRIKTAVTALLLLGMFAAPAAAINIFEKALYRRDVIKAVNAKVLVNPLTREVKYIWYDTLPYHTNGRWVPVSGTIKDQFQAMYDQQK